jgi:hypothetical protein
MSENSEALDQISQLVDKLADEDAVVREKAREALIQIGTYDVTRALVLALIDPTTHVRWEAAKVLQAMSDPVSAPALMNALDDDDEDVRWLAADGLIALQEVGILTVLNGLINRSVSTAFCKSSHHVLHEMKAHAAVLAPVLKALEQLEPAIAVPQVAYRALVTLSGSTNAK